MLNKCINRNKPPFIVAEMSGNHNSSLEKALQIVEAAANSGVDALKIQTYTADTMTLNRKEGEFLISDSDSSWKGMSLYELYQKAYTPWEWHEAIFEKCKTCGILGFSTPFDSLAVEFLETLNVPFYKIASFENIDIPLIKKVAQTGKPMIVSTGMATVAELDEMVRTARKNGCRELVLLKCTSSYPATSEESNIKTIPHMRELFQCEVGLSDHTLGIGVAIASVAMGATVIEKHFTLSREEYGVDAAFSMEPEEMKMLVEESRRAWQSMGKVCYGISEKERQSLKFRRSLYIVEDMKAGDVLTEKNMRVIRPGVGLLPKYYELLLGRKVNRDICKETPLEWKFIFE